MVIFIVINIISKSCILSTNVDETHDGIVFILADQIVNQIILNFFLIRIETVQAGRI